MEVFVIPKILSVITNNSQVVRSREFWRAIYFASYIEFSYYVTN